VECYFPTTLKNCWRHIGILPASHLARIFPNEDAQDIAEPNPNTILDEVLEVEQDVQEAIQEGLAGDMILQSLAQQYKKA
jgi:hypothetical protein